MTAEVVILETCRGVTPGGCPHAASLSMDTLAELMELAARASVPQALAGLARHMRPGRRFADLVFPGGLPGLPAWALA